MEVLLGFIGLILLVLVGLSVAGLIIGTIKPGLVLRGGQQETRSQATKIYGSAALLSLAMLVCLGAIIEGAGIGGSGEGGHVSGPGKNSDTPGEGHKDSDTKSSKTAKVVDVREGDPDKGSSGGKNDVSKNAEIEEKPEKERGPDYLEKLKKAVKKAPDSPIENIASIDVREEGGTRKAVFRIQNRMSGDWRLVIMHWGQSIRAISKSLYPKPLSAFDTATFRMENQSESGDYILYGTLTYDRTRIDDILSGGADFSSYFLRDVSDVSLRHFGKKAAKTYCREYGQKAPGFCKKAGFQIGDS